MSTPDQNAEDQFGFSANAARNKLRAIKPTVPAPDTTDIAAVDAAAEKVGFRSRESVAQTIPEYLTYGAAPTPAQRPTIAINMRVPDNVAAVFKRFCKENRYSYPEALEEIMKRAGMPTP